MCACTKIWQTFHYTNTMNLNVQLTCSFTLKKNYQKTFKSTLTFTFKFEGP